MQDVPKPKRPEGASLFSAGVFSSALSAASEAIRSPFETSIIRSPTSGISPRGDIKESEVVVKGEPLRTFLRTRQQTLEEMESTFVLSPRFKLIFLTVLGITVVAGVAQIVLAAVWQTPSPNEQSTFEAFGFAWKLGLGAIVGLLGGKVS